MTVPIAVDDPDLAKGWAHPVRVHILGLLDRRVASTSEICDELDVPFEQADRHVRSLVKIGLVRRVRSTTRGGIEHHYTATMRPKVHDDAWRRLPLIVRRALHDGGLQEAGSHVDAALEEGGFDRDDIHFSRSALRLDREGWADVARELARVLARVEQIEVESEARLARAGSGDYDVGQVVMLFFERALEGRRSDRFETAGVPSAE